MSSGCHSVQTFLPSLSKIFFVVFAMLIHYSLAGQTLTRRESLVELTIVDLRARVTVVVLCVCLSVYPSVPALAAPASVETSKQRYSRVSLRLFLD